MSKNIEDSEIAFIPLINEIIDILHFGIYAKIPIILEGSTGQGKQTAIKYIADSLGYDIINIMISKNTKADDLLGRMSISRDKETNKIKVEYIERKLLKAIKLNNESKKSIIVIHNINNASNAVLDKLTSIFDKEQNDILLQNGNREKKGEFNIIAIFNTENEIVNREKLPTLLVNSSLYFIIKKMTNDEISNIIEKKFQKTPFYHDHNLFYKSYITTINTSKEFSNENILTLNDISKYIMFRNITNGCVDESIISQMIFAYRFIQKDDIEKIFNKLNLLSLKFSSTFKFSYPLKKLSIFVNNKIKIQKKINVEKIEKRF